ncbi:MAG: formylglycine-generating enzyme family protein [bacterium]|nr:formylglycine-generating enzyme family protein [bacterium]
MRNHRINSVWRLLVAMLVSCAALTVLGAIPTNDIVAAEDLIGKVRSTSAKVYLEEQLAGILKISDQAKQAEEFRVFLAGLQPGARSAAVPAPAAPATPVAPAQPASGAHHVSVNGKIVDAKAQQEAAAQPGIPVEKTLPKSGIMLRLIPAGVFIMGSPKSDEDRSDDEVQHTVKISKPFYMGRYEVTQGQWQNVMGNNPAKFKDCGENGPVEQVSWNDCQAFLRKLEELEGLPKGSMCLPTEAQWEYACRAGTQTAFCYGNDLDSSLANINGNIPYGKGRKGEYRARTMPVGSFKPNAWGLHDMHGNVWEWCQDWSGPYATADAVDPHGSNSGQNRVVRGGGWGSSAYLCKSALRNKGLPDYANYYCGFRLSLPAGQ